MRSLVIEKLSDEYYYPLFLRIYMSTTTKEKFRPTQTFTFEEFKNKFQHDHNQSKPNQPETPTKTTRTA
jgi:hypothetical protein